MEVDDEAWGGREGCDMETNQEASPSEADTSCQGCEDSNAALPGRGRDCQDWETSPVGTPELMPRWLAAALHHLNRGA